MAIKFITGNKTKVREFNETLAPFRVEQLEIDFDEIQELDPHKIIAHKVKEAFKHHSGEFLVEDSSLYLDALGGNFPGPLVKWFNETIGSDGYAELTEKFQNFSARAITILAFAKSSENILYFEGKVKGTIVRPRGNYKFGYDPIFVPEGQVKTLAELKSEGVFNFSPREIAVKKLKEYLDHNATK